MFSSFCPFLSFGMRQRHLWSSNAYLSSHQMRLNLGLGEESWQELSVKKITPFPRCVCRDVSSYLYALGDSFIIKYIFRLNLEFDLKLNFTFHLKLNFKSHFRFKSIRKPLVATEGQHCSIPEKGRNVSLYSILYKPWLQEWVGLEELVNLCWYLCNCCWTWDHGRQTACS